MEDVLQERLGASGLDDCSCNAKFVSRIMRTLRSSSLASISWKFVRPGGPIGCGSWLVGGSPGSGEISACSQSDAGSTFIKPKASSLFYASNEVLLIVLVLCALQESAVFHPAVFD